MFWTLSDGDRYLLHGGRGEIIPELEGLGVGQFLKRILGLFNPVCITATSVGFTQRNNYSRCVIPTTWTFTMGDTQTPANSPVSKIS